MPTTGRDGQDSVFPVERKLNREKRTSDCLILACEILWDCFPDGNRLGGATFNVAYHLNQLGVNPVIIACVGCDALGDEALRVIEHDWQCDTRWIRRLADVPTGRVNVTLNGKGNASYDVIAPAAWDFVEIPAAAMADRKCPLVYPSVGLRSEFNRDQVRRALAAYPGLKCFDVNLRPPHNSIEIVTEFARMADLVVMNETELEMLTAANGSRAADLETRLYDLARILQVEHLCAHSAERPAAMWHQDKIIYGESYPTEVKDTVGAGDAFLASMITSLIRPDFEPHSALARASALGSWVASKAGAQPVYDGSQPHF
jgi:fructokinase